MKLSPLELEVLNYISDAIEATAPAVHAEIQKKRDTAYSTIKTVFDRLEKKGAIRRSKKVGRTNFYCASVTKQSVQTTLVNEFVSRVFSHDKMALLNTLEREQRLTTEEIDYLQALLEEDKKKA